MYIVLSVWNTYPFLPLEEFCLKNCMSVKLSLSLHLPGRINHSVLYTTSVPFIYLFRCFLCTTSNYLGLLIPVHDCCDNFCENVVHLHAGTAWQYLASGLCTFISHCFPPHMCSLLDGEVAWDTSGICSGSCICNPGVTGSNALGGHPWLVKSRVIDDFSSQPPWRLSGCSLRLNIQLSV